MLRSLLLLLTLIGSGFAYAEAKDIQVDLIVFANPSQPTKTENNLQKQPLILIDSKAIALIEEPSKSPHFYQRLKPSSSELQDEYYRLSHNASYKVLAQYSWRQPDTNQKTIRLTPINKKGWAIQGTVRVKKSNYYSFDAQLQCSPPSMTDSSFVLKHKQGLKKGMAYYFDHPKIGIILKIHS